MKTVSLDPYQLAAVNAPLTPSQAIQAVAGSGKTTVLAARIEALVSDHSIAPADIIAITFTAAGGAALRAKLPFEIGFAGTLHALLVKASRIAPGIIMSEPEVDEAIREAIKDTSLGIPLSTGREMLIDDEANPIGNAKIFLRAFERVVAWKSKTTFDLIQRDFAFKRAFKVASPRVLIVDEYQDTSPLDEACYRAIAAEFEIVVGDPFQSIYQFRGSTPRFLRRRARGGSFDLPTSWRASASVALLASALTGQRFTADPLACMGDASEYRFNNRHDELVWLAGTATKDGDAILARYNAEVEEIRETLKARGVKLRPRLRTRGTDSANDRLVLAHLRFAAGTIDFSTFLKELPERQWDAVTKRWGGTMASMEEVGETRLSRYLELLFAPDFVREHPAVFDASNPDVALEAFLAIEEETAKASTTGVFVDTIHASKGLEFERVFLTGCDERFDNPEPGEGLNLLYVAVTRSKRTVIVTSAEEHLNRFSGKVDRTKRSETMTRALSTAGVPGF